MVADILTSFQQITFNHDTLDEFSYIRIVVAAVKHFTLQYESVPCIVCRS